MKKDILNIIKGVINTDYWDSVQLGDYIDSLIKTPSQKITLVQLLEKVGSVSLHEPITNYDYMTDYSTEINKSCMIIYDLVKTYLQTHPEIIIVTSIDYKGYNRYLVKSTENNNFYDITWDDDYEMSIESDEFKSSIYRTLNDFIERNKQFPINTKEFVDFIKTTY